MVAGTAYTLSGSVTLGLQWTVVSAGVAAVSKVTTGPVAPRPAEGLCLLDYSVWK